MINLFFYCEAKSNKSAVLDVHNLDDLKQWWENLDIGLWTSTDQRSLIEINKLKTVKYRGLREGLWYDIPDSIWRDFSFDTMKFSYDQKDPSLLFRLSATYNGIEELDLASYRIKNLEERN